MEVAGAPQVLKVSLAGGAGEGESRRFEIRSASEPEADPDTQGLRQRLLTAASWVLDLDVSSQTDILAGRTVVKRVPGQAPRQSSPFATSKARRLRRRSSRCGGADQAASSGAAGAGTLVVLRRGGRVATGATGRDPRRRHGPREDAAGDQRGARADPRRLLQVGAGGGAANCVGDLGKRAEQVGSRALADAGDASDGSAGGGIGKPFAAAPTSCSLTTSSFASRRRRSRSSGWAC